MLADPRSEIIGETEIGFGQQSPRSEVNNTS